MVEHYKCWDCGSTIPGRHTALCDLTDETDVKDLPCKPGTQWWTGGIPNISPTETA